MSVKSATVPLFLGEYGTVSLWHKNSRFPAPRPLSHFSCEVIRRSTTVGWNVFTLAGCCFRYRKICICVRNTEKKNTQWLGKFARRFSETNKGCVQPKKSPGKSFRKTKTGGKSLKMYVVNPENTDKYKCRACLKDEGQKKKKNHSYLKGFAQKKNQTQQQQHKNDRRWLWSKSQFLHGAAHSSSLSWLFTGPNSL